mgnify:CR=1 FL=1
MKESVRKTFLGMEIVDIEENLVSNKTYIYLKNEHGAHFVMDAPKIESVKLLDES